MTIYIYNKSLFYHEPPSINNNDVPQLKIVGAEHVDFSPILIKFESLDALMNLRDELNKLFDLTHDYFESDAIL